MYTVSQVTFQVGLEAVLCPSEWVMQDSDGQMEAVSKA